MDEGTSEKVSSPKRKKTPKLTQDRKRLNYKAEQLESANKNGKNAIMLARWELLWIK